MGLFLAERVSTRTAFWLFGVAVTTSVISLATLSSEQPTAPRGAPIWKSYGCKPRAATPDARPRLMIGPMIDAGTYRDVLRETVQSSLAKQGTWSLALVEQPPASGYFVDGTIDSIEVERTGDKSFVKCELTLWVRSGETSIALAAGNARVATTANQRDIALSRQACVTTVAEDIVEKKLSAAVIR